MTEPYKRQSADRLTRGANTEIAGESFKAALSWDSGTADDGIDISALLLTDVGRVRDDEDFIFYNQPLHRSGAVAHTGRVVGARVTETLDIQPGHIEQITRIVFVASIHSGNFSAVRNIRLDLGAAGAERVTFPIEGCAVSAPRTESTVASWYKVKHDLSIDFSTRLTVGDVAQTFKQVLRAKSRKAEFKAIEQLSDPFDQFNDNAEFAAAAIAKEFTKMWAVQIYIYELGDERGVTLRVIGESGFSRAFDGFQNSFSKTTGRRKADDVIAALRQSDRQFSWATG